jgi:hypothetical protein
VRRRRVEASASPRRGSDHVDEEIQAGAACEPAATDLSGDFQREDHAVSGPRIGDHRTNVSTKVGLVRGTRRKLYEEGVSSWTAERGGLPILLEPITNPQLERGTLVLYGKPGNRHSNQRSAPARRPDFICQPIFGNSSKRVTFERARTRGGRSSVSALLVEMIEQHRKALEKELALQIARSTCCHPSSPQPAFRSQQV